MKNLAIYSLFALSLLVFVAIFIWSIRQMWINWQIEQALDDHGVITTGIILACNSGSKNAPVTFKYEVVDQNGKSRRYETTNSGGGSSHQNCRKGKEIVLRYLPESPEIARHSHNSNIFINIVTALASLVIIVAFIRAAIKEGIAS